MIIKRLANMTQAIVERSIEQAYLKGIEDAKKSSDCVKCEDEIRAEVIDELIDLLDKYHIHGDLIKDLEQLKEHKNE